METKPRPATRALSKTPSVPQLRWPVSERCELQRTELGRDAASPQPFKTEQLNMPPTPEARTADRAIACLRNGGVGGGTTARCPGHGCQCPRWGLKITRHDRAPDSAVSSTRDPQAMTTLNRRALVTGAAALVPAPALCGPVIHPDAELLDIGEQIKKRLPATTKRAKSVTRFTRTPSTQQAPPSWATSRRARNGNGLLTRADIRMRLREQMSSICLYASSPSAQAKAHYGRRKERPSRQWPRLWRWIV